MAQEFAVKRPKEACQAIMFYLERCWVLDNKHRRQPGHALALEVPLPTSRLCSCLQCMLCCAVLEQSTTLVLTPDMSKLQTRV